MDWGNLDDDDDPDDDIYQGSTVFGGQDLNQPQSYQYRGDGGTTKDVTAVNVQTRREMFDMLNADEGDNDNEYDNVMAASFIDVSSCCH